MKRLLICAAGVVVLLLGMACQPPPAASSSAETPKAGEARRDHAASRDLSQDEDAGGHVLRKHVGRSDAELRERLERERNISAASTYTDRATAEQAVGEAIAASQGRIQRWLDRSGNRPNLVLDYDSSQPIGRTLNRGESGPQPCSHAVVVLKYSAPSYYVLTSYPECRS